jgi:8-amino-7-oxononanoate synthase
MTSHDTTHAHAKPAPAGQPKQPVDLFQKCRAFTRADEIKAAGFYPYFRPIEENEGPVVTIEGRKVIMAGSNNYHGLTADRRVKEAAIRAIENTGRDVPFTLPDRH